MPSIENWTISPGGNTTSDPGAAFPEGQQGKTINNGTRGMMGRIAEYRTDLGGGLVSAGSASVMTLTISRDIAAYADGFRTAFRAGTTNTGATTLNINSKGAKPIKIFDGGSGEIDVKGGQIRAGGIYEVAYSSIANGGLGAFILLNVGGGAATAVFERRVAYNSSTTLTTGAWTTWPLDVEVSDPSDLGALASDTLTVSRNGRVRWEAYASPFAASAADSTFVKTRLFNVTNSSIIKTGSLIAVGNGNDGVVRIGGVSVGSAPVEAGKAYRVQYYVFTTGGSANFNGFGLIGAPDLGDILSLQVTLEAT